MTILNDMTNKRGISFSKEDIDKNIRMPIYGCMNDFYTSSIPLDQISHVFSNFRYEGNKVVADCTILDTPVGKVLSSLDENGVELETNMVYVCNVKDDVASNVNIIAINLVAKS